MKAKYYILYLFTFFSITGICQKNYWTISGSVVDEKKMPVQFANVFVNNTSIGNSTNENGNFQLNIPGKFAQIELIVSFVGYKTIKRKINYSPEIQVFRFQLESDNMLREVVVSAKHDKDWKKKWKIFERALLGDSKFAKDCEILNKDVVKLEYDKDKKVIATAKDPLLIKNTALGYKILFKMDKFESDGITTYLSGLKFFERIDTSNTNLKNKWDKNQKDVFSDSFRNFLVALTLNKLEENDFEVFKMTVVKNMYYGQTTVANEIKDGVLIPVDATKICTYDKDTESFFIHSEYPLLVFLKKRFHLKPFFADYPFKYSEIVLPKSYAGFTDNGWLSRPNGIVLKDYWGYEGFANLLPDDYNVEGLVKETSEATIINKIEQKPIANISEAKEKPLEIIPKSVQPTSDVESQGVQLEKKTQLGNKEESGEFKIVDADYKIQIKESDNSLTIYDLLRRIPGLRVTFSSATGGYTMAFAGSNTSMQAGTPDPTPALVLDGNFIGDSSQVMAIISGLTVRDIKEIGAIKYGNSAAYGSRGGNGIIVINLVK